MTGGTDDSPVDRVPTISNGTPSEKNKSEAIFNDHGLERARLANQRDGPVLLS
jgi:hypothetical protein